MPAQLGDHQPVAVRARAVGRRFLDDAIGDLIVPAESGDAHVCLHGRHGLRGQRSRHGSPRAAARARLVPQLVSAEPTERHGQRSTTAATAGSPRPRRPGARRRHPGSRRTRAGPAAAAAGPSTGRALPRPPAAAPVPRRWTVTRRRASSQLVLRRDQLVDLAEDLLVVHPAYGKGPARRLPGGGADLPRGPGRCRGPVTGGRAGRQARRHPSGRPRGRLRLSWQRPDPTTYGGTVRAWIDRADEVAGVIAAAAADTTARPARALQPILPGGAQLAIDLLRADPPGVLTVPAPPRRRPVSRAPAPAGRRCWPAMTWRWPGAAGPGADRRAGARACGATTSCCRCRRPAPW